MTLVQKNYRFRFADVELESMLKSFGAVSVEGPKWCGKTWTARNHSNSEFSLADPANDYNNRKLARMNSNHALDGEIPRLIDEWQDAPGIWDAVRYEVDKTGEVGRFILCGSSMPNRDGISHSGAGRIGSMRMRTMSLFESGDSNGKISLQSLFGAGFKDKQVSDTNLRQLIDITVRGGWPALVGRSTDAAIMANRDYVSKVTGEDIMRIDGGTRHNTNKMMKVMRSLARNESTLASNSRIKSDAKTYEDENVDVETVALYSGLLNRLFLIEDQPAFSPNLRSSVRVGKTPKRHLADPSLAIAALELTPKMLFDNLGTYGFMFEAMCERDLQIYARAGGGRLYHYRDSNNREIDAIVQMPSGSWGAFEIKLGADQTDKAAENLLAMAKVFGDSARPPEVLCVISGLETHAYRREDGVFVVPITALKD